MRADFIKLSVVRLILGTAVLLCASFPAKAQGTEYAMKAGEILSEPVCFTVENRAPYTVFGSISTDVHVRPDGQKARHRSNFRLQQKERARVCSSGPFYEGRRVEFVLRTLIPVFSCKTSVMQDVVIQSRQKPEGGTETFAVCS